MARLPSSSVYRFVTESFLSFLTSLRAIMTFKDNFGTHPSFRLEIFFLWRKQLNEKMKWMIFDDKLNYLLMMSDVVYAHIFMPPKILYSFKLCAVLYRKKLINFLFWKELFKKKIKNKLYLKISNPLNNIFLLISN